MEYKTDNIYIYLWEEFNTIYIGRTKNPKSRHYQHRHIQTESTYQFSSEHHVEHPKMVIIENDLTVEEGAERERYWISYYRENSPYKVLNKSRGGQTGRTPRYSEEERKEHSQLSSKKYYLANREKKLAYSKEYREKHYNEIREREKNAYEEKTKQQKKFREITKRILKVERETLKEIQEKRNAKKNELRRKEYNRKYYQSHRKSSKPYKSGVKFDYKEYYRKHKEELIAKQKEYNKMHKEEKKEYMREYMKQYRSLKKNIKNVK